MEKRAPMSNRVVREWVGQDGYTWVLMAYWVGTGWQYAKRRVWKSAVNKTGDGRQS